ncbi:hypothetical protein [Ancylobacter mangrovi]|uniref:hypothetical protein n=1 Tax=Ancylobacter mangrovi TaxID=2972472 RepID=UPI00216380B3|nr:hypothetical protein [Ancylobacter mangrovi]MCS0501404.1 hypothetical protein [Ancylobacter mangrovi]
MANPFSAEEDARLRELHARKASASTIARVLAQDGFPARTRNAVISRLHRLGLARPATGRAGWTPAMDAVLREGVAEGLTPRAIAERMAARRIARRSRDAVDARIAKLGLRRPATGPGSRADGRRERGGDPLIAALRAAHGGAERAPAADVRPPPRDGMRVNWGELVPVAGACGSAGALCAELA